MVQPDLRSNHLLWLIEHHPDSDVFRLSTVVTAMAPDYSGVNSPNIERARALWLRQAEEGSGTISGDRLRGQILHGSGGDWLLLRADGAGQLDVRITVKTDDAALIYMRYEGIVAGDALPRVLGGEAVPPADYYFRTTPYFETSSEKYAWLNKIVAVGVGQVDLSKGWVGYKVYEVG